MPNGKPGDHPLSDLLNHGIMMFDEELDQLIIKLMMDTRNLETKNQVRAMILEYDALKQLDPEQRRQLIVELEEFLNE